MKHVIYLKLDKEFQEIYRIYCEITEFEIDFPGHLSLCALQQKPADFQKIANELKTDIQSLEINYHSIGTFLTNERVMYLAASKTPVLSKVQESIFKKYSDGVPEHLVSHYMPSHWAPHSTIAWPFSEGSFEKAFFIDKKIIEKAFRIEAIELAKTDPFKVLESVTV